MDYYKLTKAAIEYAVQYGAFDYDSADDVWTMYIDLDFAESMGEYLATNSDDEAFLELFAPGGAAETCLLRAALVGRKCPAPLLRGVGWDWLERHRPDIEAAKSVNHRLEDRA